MYTNNNRLNYLIFSGLLLVFLSACAIPVFAGSPLQPTPADGVPQTAADAPAPTAAFTASPPQPIHPYIVTRQAAAVRAGPSIDVEVTHSIEAGALLPVQGHSPDGQWWAVPGPGDGPGPLSWIQAGDVDFFGDASGVPVLQPPSGGPDVPVHSDPGAPPGNACVAEPFGSGLEPVYIRLGPGEQFNFPSSRYKLFVADGKINLCLDGYNEAR